ncbi:hypothetical protein CPC08DRAFT_608202, partial [Agrocybe pediades]
IGGISSPVLQWGAFRLGTMHQCPVCKLVLLTGERKGFCCGKDGSKFNDVLPLPPLPEEYNTFINDPNISSKSRILNLAYSFASMETTHDFPAFSQGNAFVAIQGKVYHR